MVKSNADSRSLQCSQVTPTKAYFTSEKLFALHVNQACLKWPGEETGGCSRTPLCDLSSSINVCFTSVSGGIHYMNRHYQTPTERLAICKSNKHLQANQSGRGSRLRKEMCFWKSLHEWCHINISLGMAVWHDVELCMGKALCLRQRQWWIALIIAWASTQLPELLL